jgi:hypothetical protein
MKRHFGVLLAGFIVFSVLDAAAQQPQPATPTPPRTIQYIAPQAVPAPPPARPQVVPAPPPPVRQGVPVTSSRERVTTAVDESAGGQPVNIRVEVTIVDQTSTGQPVRRVINILAADRSFARIRSLFTDTMEPTAINAPGARSPDNRRVDVDARPRIVGNSIRVELVIQNNALGSGNPLLNWTQSFTVFLENGKVATPIESTDPSTSRKMSIEVKATILK